MRVDQAFPSKYLKGEQLSGPVDVTIQTVRQEKAYLPGEGQKPVWVLYVVHGSKGVILNKGLANGIAQVLSEPEMDNWPGKRVQLYPEQMTVGGRQIVTIRARAAAAAMPAGQNGNGNGQSEPFEDNEEFEDIEEV